MTVVAALCIGVACALLAGIGSGAVQPRRARRPTRRASASQRLWLQQAGVALSPGRFWLGSVAAGGFALLVLVGITGSLFVALVPAVAVAVVPRAFFARRRRTRLRAVQAAWPDGLRDLIASISAGRSLTQAVNELARNGPPSLRVAFARFPDLAQTLGPAPALAIVQEELADPTSDRVIEVLLVAQERGGAVVRSILEDLVDATTRDLKLLDEIETEGLETRINARAVVLLPWLVLVVLTARAGPFRVFYRSPAGAATLAVAGALTVVGVVVLGRLGRERAEPRVFGADTA